MAAVYLYLPVPVLPPLRIDAALIAAQRQALGELPAQRATRYRTTFGLGAIDVQRLVVYRAIGDWFERVVAAGAEAKAACNWLGEDVLPACHELGIELAAFPLRPERLAGLLALVAEGATTLVAAKKVFRHLLAHDVEPSTALRELGLDRITDPATLQPAVAAAIAALPAAAEAVREGKDKAIDALKGHVMRATRGRADPALVDALLRSRIAGPK
ncbi:MAG: hypothetical protein JNK15_14520 [Planctomycetes bacterium]|nr:hypothetical protein [Planctomycetota bacterium]